MSFEGNIFIHLENKLPIDFIDFLGVFKQHNWHYIIDGVIRYIPLHDNGMYNWQIVSEESEQEVLRILGQKHKQDELISLCFINDGYGMVMSYNASSEEISFDLNFYRKEIESSSNRLTDFSWYLNKIEPVLVSSGLVINSVRCEVNWG